MHRCVSDHTLLFDVWQGVVLEVRSRCHVIHADGRFNLGYKLVTLFAQPLNVLNTVFLTLVPKAQAIRECCLAQIGLMQDRCTYTSIQQAHE